jgi:hypothetical protein
MAMRNRVEFLRPWALLAALVAPSVALAGPITLNTALPVHDGELIVRQEAMWIRSTGDPSPLNMNLNVIAAPAILYYGVNADLTLLGVLPFLHKQVAVTTPMGRVTRTTNGFGDMMVAARYTLLALDRPGETFRIAPFAGVKLPTGAQNEADALGRFPQPFQLGTGSWDPLGGAVLTWQTLRRELDVSATYQVRTEANGFRAGDEARADASFQYRLVPWGALGPGVPSYLFGVLESAVLWNGQNRVSGVDDSNSGGFTWYVTPGLQYISERSVIEGAFEIPVVQRLNGSALKNDFVAILSFRQSF